MESALKIVILAICLVVILGFGIILCYGIVQKNNTKKMYSEVEKVLEGMIIQSKKEKFKLERIMKAQYDYVFHTPYCKYYIKVIPNLANEEICVNNSVKWQLRKSFNDESMRFVDHVEGLMRMDISVNSSS